MLLLAALLLAVLLLAMLLLAVLLLAVLVLDRVRVPVRVRVLNGDVRALPPRVRAGELFASF